ncbi:hypothetical protein TRVL_05812 [Trypanosoma vivax]|nr:hypothetical protein TRVL_05812 [Trypanosoma vivax]
MIGLKGKSLTLDADSVPSTSFLKKFEAFDFFPKPKEDYRRSQTTVGALVSVVTLALILLLVLWEGVAYIYGRDAYRTELAVDTSLTKEVVFNIDISFPQERCNELFLDVFDATGSTRFNVTMNVHKTPLDASGKSVFVGERHFHTDYTVPQYNAKFDPTSPKFCGKCFVGRKYSYLQQPETPCCNTCEQVMEEFERRKLAKPSKSTVEQCIGELSEENPGCNYRGSLKLKKASGTLIFAPKMFENVFRINDLMQFNASHVINKLSIGDDLVRRFSKRGVYFPLNNQRFVTTKQFAQVRYFMKIVPTTYISDNTANPVASTYEYSVQWDHRQVPLGSGEIPSVVFSFDFSSMQVNNYFQRPSFCHFIVSLCGIVGGLFVVLGMVDGLVARVLRLL